MTTRSTTMQSGRPAKGASVLHEPRLCDENSPLFDAMRRQARRNVETRTNPDSDQSGWEFDGVHFPFTPSGVEQMIAELDIFHDGLHVSASWKESSPRRPHEVVGK